MDKFLAHKTRKPLTDAGDIGNTVDEDVQILLDDMMTVRHRESGWNTFGHYSRRSDRSRPKDHGPLLPVMVRVARRLPSRRWQRHRRLCLLAHCHLVQNDDALPNPRYVRVHYVHPTMHFAQEKRRAARETEKERARLEREQQKADEKAAREAERQRLKEEKDRERREKEEEKERQRHEKEEAIKRQRREREQAAALAKEAKRQEIEVGTKFSFFA
jgi:hypothetical protein